MESYTKSVNTDKRSRKRLKFASSKERSKRASADVYRSYKRKVGVTSAATREEIVHNSTKINTNKGERWFCDEAEAVAAGWRAPLN